MRNRVEILRAICFNEDQMSSLTVDGFDFSQIEIEFMTEFKKIYENGETQLLKFLDLLEDHGSELDEYSIQYYVNQLTNGPLISILLPLLKKDDDSFRNYFGNRPDIMGVVGNPELTKSNSPTLEGYRNPYGCPLIVLNKMPKFLQDMTVKSTDTVENVFKSSMRSSVIVDNTLPLVEKDNQGRYSEEPTGERVLKSHGNLLMKDSYYYQNMGTIREQIFEKVSDILGEENFRMYKDSRLYNPFDPERNNTLTSKHIVITPVVEVLYDLDRNDFMTYNGNVMEALSGRFVENDLFGNAYDSDELRAIKQKIPNVGDFKEFNLNSNFGDDSNGQISI